MACLGITFSASKRRKLGNVLCVLHLLCATCGLAFVGLGIYIKIRISVWLTLVDGYNNTLLPLMLVIVGAMLALIDAAGARLVTSAVTSSKVRYLLIPYLCIVIILNLCILAAGSICFIHRQHLESAFHRGLIHAMQRYKDIPVPKEDAKPAEGHALHNLYKTEIDLVQTEFQCCGNNGYEDWFDVQWVHDKFIDLEDKKVQNKMSNGLFLNDDVPFSCCNPLANRNCIHHHVHDNDLHYNYDYRTGLTLYRQGCKDKLMVYYSFRLCNVGAIVMVMFGMQTFMLIGLRYLQTALKHASAAEDPEAESEGWLFKRLPSKPATTKAWRGKKDRDVESAQSDAEVTGQSDDADGSGEEQPLIDSFDSDSFESDEEDGEDDDAMQRRSFQEYQVEQLVAEEPLYANVPFHEDKEKLKDALTTKKTSPPPRPTESPNDKKSQKKNEKTDVDSKKSKKDSPKKTESSKKTSKKEKKEKASSKKEATKSKKEAKTTSKKEATKSPKKDAASKKSTSSKSKKSPTAKKTSLSTKKKSPSTKKKSPSMKKKSPSMKKKSPSMKKKSPSMKKKSTKKSGKLKMKNKNNNIDDFSSSSLSSSDESDAMDTTPLLSRFYSSSGEEELSSYGDELRVQPIGRSDPPIKEVGGGYGGAAGPSPEVTWLLSRTQFYSSSPSSSILQK